MAGAFLLGACFGAFVMIIIFILLFIWFADVQQKNETRGRQGKVG